MRATRIEVRTKALGAGRHRNGVWEPAGQLIATLWCEEPDDVARAVAAAITVVDGEEVVATVEGRQEIPSE